MSQPVAVVLPSGENLAKDNAPIANDHSKRNTQLWNIYIASIGFGIALTVLVVAVGFVLLGYGQNVFRNSSYSRKKLPSVMSRSHIFRMRIRRG